jgi:hypothetical protein
MVAYCWDNGSRKTSKGSTATITVPNTFEVGSTHTLDIQAVTTEDVYSSPKSYKVKIAGTTEPTKVSVTVKNGSTTLTNGSNGTLSVGDKYSTLTKSAVDSITLNGNSIKEEVAGLSVSANNISKEGGSTNVAVDDVTKSTGTYKVDYSVYFTYKGKSVSKSFTQTVVVQ